jgi:hypothetical protein
MLLHECAARMRLEITLEFGGTCGVGELAGASLATFAW